MSAGANITAQTVIIHNHHYVTDSQVDFAAPDTEQAASNISKLPAGSVVVDTSIPLRRTVARFAELMEHRLQLVEGQPGKTGWKGDSNRELIERLAAKLAALENALSSDTDMRQLGYLAADAGNYLMMLADNGGGLIV
jgi:hypothetical protein